MTAGQVFVAALPYLEGLLALVLGGGWLKSWLTIKAQRKAADLANDASAVALLEKDIERKIAEIAKKEEKIAQLEDKVASKATIIEDMEVHANKRSRQMSRLSTCMCIHLGCPLRDPQVGAGMRWFVDNEADFNLGTDYKTLTQLIAEKKYGNDEEKQG